MISERTIGRVLAWVLATVLAAFIAIFAWAWLVAIPGLPPG